MPFGIPKVHRDNSPLSPFKAPQPMASQNKQHKRAQRAKAKAKQNRVRRTSEPSEALPVDDDRIDLESVDLTDLFIRMRDAETTSQQAMCSVFLEDPLLEIVLEQEGEENATDFILSALIEYRQWATEATEEAALAWIESPTFQADYVAASNALQKTAS